MTRKARDHNKHVILGSLPGTRKDIQIATGLSKTTVQGWITRLHKERVIRISKWVKPTPNSIPTAYYRKGSAPDAECRLKPITNTEKQTRWRNRLKARDPEAYELLMKKSLARLWELAARTRRRDPLMAALYGQIHEGESTCQSK
ncbi:MAG: hypothetical protein WCZ87_02415 [Thiohalobacteraceae bacterium]